MAARSGSRLQPTWSASSHQDRFASVLPYLAGKDVLDVGAASGHRRPDWMHRLVAEVATSAIGIELDPAAAAAAAGLGFDVRQGDAERLTMSETFDVVWAGELIEHLSCPGAFLDGVKRLLRPSGRLVLTTPNPFGISNFVYRLTGTPRVNRGHVAWFCPTTLAQLLARHGFDVETICFLDHETPGTTRRLLARAVRAPLPDRLAHNTILAVARIPAVAGGPVGAS